MSGAPRPEGLHIAGVCITAYVRLSIIETCLQSVNVVELGWDRKGAGTKRSARAQW
jgi:hypothetical protein